MAALWEKISERSEISSGRERQRESSEGRGVGWLKGTEIDGTEQIHEGRLYLYVFLRLSVSLSIDLPLFVLVFGRINNLPLPFFSPVAFKIVIFDHVA